MKKKKTVDAFTEEHVSNYSSFKAKNINLE